MKRILIALCALTIGAALFAPHALAGVTIQRFTVTGELVNTCNSEVIHVDMNLQLLTRTTHDANGVLHFGTTLTNSFRGTTDGGARYIGHEHQSHEFRAEPGLIVTHSFTDDEHVIRLGEDGTADDFVLHSRLHVTFNANGELVSYNEELELGCM